MTSFRNVLCGSAIALAAFVAAGAASAATLSGALTADNSFHAYLSTSDNVLGTALVDGNNWQATYNFGPTSLTAGTTYYLHVVADNAEGSTDTNGGWDGFIGSFNLAGSGFAFANGLQHLGTDITNWRATGEPAYGTTWSAPMGAPKSEGANGVGPWGLRPGISEGASWIWSQHDPSGEAFFSTTITADRAGAVPEPASWALMIAGFGLAGAALRRRRAAAAAA